MKPLEADGNTVQQWELQVRDMIKAENYKDALTVFDDANRNNPRDKKYWVYRGMLLQKLMRFREAVQSYNQALKIDPTLKWVKLMRLRARYGYLWRAQFVIIIVGLLIIFVVYLLR